ncbi:terminase small subunit [Acinetobacter bohemicus]|uniref:Phage terminase small subunit n=1 Tax=Acinetobacter bohemicus TaxID=1435036 RepID=A0A1I6UC59_9GAMM|nr:terminase small subunit [Acinetobacter bohemicus]KAB0653141.1 terminase small subunit [Acinetobacter bohemicus]SFS99025.1 phage terminase small subunit [Acinetobacter bohemicus]
MALTAKSKAFAQAVVDGMSNKDAAISAGYSEKTAMQQGSKLAKLPEVIAYIAKLKADKKLTSTDEKLTSSKPKPTASVQVVKVEKIESGPEQAHGQFVGRDEIAIGAPEDPLEYLKTVWMNEQEDPKLRLDAAKAAMPYIHGKVADKGKKQTQEEEAHAAAKSGGKFATRAARKANYS